MMMMMRGGCDEGERERENLIGTEKREREQRVKAESRQKTNYREAVAFTSVQAR